MKPEYFQSDLYKNLWGLSPGVGMMDLHKIIEDDKKK